MDRQDHEHTIELSLPSQLGAEKVVRHTIARLGAELRIAGERLADLQTAVSEACINAIEHGNRLRSELPVKVTLRVAAAYVEVLVCDAGIVAFRPPELPLPPIHDKLAGLAPARGLGLLLMHQLVDEVDFLVADSERGNCCRLRLYLRCRDGISNPRDEGRPPTRGKEIGMCLQLLGPKWR